ncbi:unnamed protein product [marine sediment metagenome]|uniref:Uncharacterized protein n=1 Tax=marine sediment metagenome TaxID=412755 RepID=X1AH51_9ZZZZ
MKISEKYESFNEEKVETSKIDFKKLQKNSNFIYYDIYYFYKYWNVLFYHLLKTNFFPEGEFNADVENLINYFFLIYKK